MSQVACSLDPEGRLTFKGRFTPKQIESVVKKYMLAYVQCQMCKSFDTNLVKDSTTRLTFIECNRCQVGGRSLPSPPTPFPLAGSAAGRLLGLCVVLSGIRSTAEGERRHVFSPRHG